MLLRPSGCRHLFVNAPVARTVRSSILLLPLQPSPRRRLDRPVNRRSFRPRQKPLHVKAPTLSPTCPVRWPFLPRLHPSRLRPIPSRLHLFLSPLHLFQSRSPDHRCRYQCPHLCHFLRLSLHLHQSIFRPPTSFRCCPCHHPSWGPSRRCRYQTHPCHCRVLH